jgi:hypothetical protein
MALKTPAEVVTDWIEIRDNILPEIEEAGLPAGALDTAIALSVIQGSGGGGSGGLTQDQHRDAVRDGIDQSADVETIKTNTAQPTTRATSSIVLTTALTENSFTLAAVRQFEIGNGSGVPLRYSFVANNTLNSANFTPIPRDVLSRSESDILFTGNLFISAESLPTPLTISSTTTSGSPTVTTGASFSGASVGQAISGTGIPANTRIGSINAAGTSLTLVAADGATPVNATASGTNNLTISGAIIRLSTWS